MNATEVISVDKDKCNNCHACIDVCPVKSCIDATGNVVSIINDRCIACGRCVRSCRQTARSYFDDTERLLSDLESGQKIVMLIAPATVSVFPDILKLVSYLRSIGICAVFDVSFGAELFVKSCIEETKVSHPALRINSSCPVIVTWCEVYKPELLKYLVPVQTPMLHTAIMIREFFKQYNECKIAALSPCAAKRREFIEEGMIEYNVTLSELKKHLIKNNINLLDFNDGEIDGPYAERGVAFSIPGGMHELLLRYTPGMQNTRRVQGISVFNYLNAIPNMQDDDFYPQWIDCLNCSRGCNGGPGTSNSGVHIEKIEFPVRRRMFTHIKKYNSRIKKEVSKYWKAGLYNRTFSDKSALVSNMHVPDELQLQAVFREMGKRTSADFLNCSACGYGSCESMAGAIFNNLNKPENCSHFLREKAEAASQIKSNFLATMSHEIRTPLNSILGLTEIELQKIKSEETNDYLQKIKNSGATLLGIINDVLDISKIETGKLELIAEPYETASLINDTVQLNLIRAAEKPIQFLLEIAKNVPACLIGDELRVKQILNNLLSNAFKYTRRGSVKLDISFESKETGGYYLVFTVSDTGIGIHHDDIKKLFVEYTQLDNKSNRKIEGTGLGLAITKNLVEMMSGNIHVESKYGSGSSFCVHIEQTPDGDAVLTEKTIETLQQLKWMPEKIKQSDNLVRLQMPYGRVLVVDDVQTNLDVAKGLISIYGIKVDTATGGQEAIDLINSKDTEYDAVFIDYMMPVMDGIATVKKIKTEIKKDYIKKIPLIALTADATIGSREKFLEYGFSDFISKPINIFKLDEILKMYIRNAEKEKTIVKDLPDESAVNNESEICMEGINYKMAQQRFGSKKIFFEIVVSFVRNTPILIEKIKKINHETLMDYAIIVHGIKSTCRAIGADEEGALAEELENAAKQGRLGFCITANKCFLKKLEILIEKLKAFISGFNACK
ncbi:MAG: response regulator [Spirochaetaceae bacterium]|jgi:signal transduction histidine kinase/CheY-like chemotaxis protein/iron only hydrogenase large subunit-like protein/HPt (histidine-containing phosphotransfer) domain-containing protein|nr:response regulator [Spirochaetaceae bacterium]